jgi:hypothetical protein
MLDERQTVIPRSGEAHPFLEGDRHGALFLAALANPATSFIKELERKNISLD